MAIALFRHLFVGRTVVENMGLLLNIGRALAVVVLLTTTVLPAVADQNTGTIRGYVYVAHSKTPVCGIRVYADSDNEMKAATVTDSKGFFVFISRRTGTVHIAVDDPNPFAERMVDIHPNFHADTVLYVNRRVHTMSSNCGAGQLRKSQ